MCEKWWRGTATQTTMAAEPVGMDGGELAAWQMLCMCISMIEGRLLEA